MTPFNELAATGWQLTLPAVPMVHAPSHSSFAPAGPSGSQGRPIVSKVQTAVMAAVVLPSASSPSPTDDRPDEQPTATIANVKASEAPRDQRM
jgi:hypothetical protein